MNATEFAKEFERRLQEEQALLDTHPSGYRYSWVNPRTILARMELEGLKIDTPDEPWIYRMLRKLGVK